MPITVIAEIAPELQALQLKCNLEVIFYINLARCRHTQDVKCPKMSFVDKL